MIRLSLKILVVLVVLLLTGLAQKVISQNVILPSLEKSHKESNAIMQNLKVSGQYQFDQQITIPLNNNEFNEISIILGRLIFKNQNGSWFRQQNCKFIPKHMQIDMDQKQENQQVLEIKLPADQQIKDLASNEDNRFYFLTEKHDAYIYDLKVKTGRSQNSSTSATQHQKTGQNIFQLKKVQKLSLVNHKIDHIVYSKQYQQLFGYNKHQIWIIYTNEAGNRVNFQSILQFDRSSGESIKKAFIYKGIVFVINGNNHLLIYQFIGQDDLAIHLELIQQISHFKKTINIEVVDLIYRNGTLWLLDYEYGIYQYQVVIQNYKADGPNTTDAEALSRFKIEQKQSYKIKHGYKLGIYLLPNNIFQIIFEFKKKQYIIELWLNQDTKEMFINRFYHQINQPVGIITINDNYMSVVAKKVVSLVRYGVNAGLWGNIKWLKLQQNSTVRNLQIGQEEDNLIDQQVQYKHFATTSSQFYTSFRTKSFTLTSLKQNQNKKYAFLVGFTQNKVFFKRLVDFQPKIICSFSGQKLKKIIGQQKIVNLKQTLTLQYIASSQYISPSVSSGQEVKLKENRLLNYFQSSSPLNIQLDITLIDPQVKRAQLFYYYLQIGIYILAGIFIALILTLCCVIKTRKQKRTSLRKLNQSLDRQMKQIELGSHKKSVLYQSKKQQQMKSSQSAN